MREQLVNQAIIAAIAQRDEVDQYIEALRALLPTGRPVATEIIETTLKRRGRPSTKAAPAQAGERKGRTPKAKTTAPVAAVSVEKAKHKGRPVGSKNKPKASVLPEQMPSPVFEGDELDQRVHEKVTA